MDNAEFLDPMNYTEFLNTTACTRNITRDDDDLISPMTPTIRAAVAFAGLTVTVAIFGVSFVVWNWKKPIIQISQRCFLLGFCISMLFLSLCLLIGAIPWASSVTICGAVAIIIPSAFTSVLVTLLVKEYKAWKLHRVSQSLQRLKLNGMMLVLLAAGGTLVMFLYCLVIVLLFPIKPRQCELFGCGRTPLALSIGIGIVYAVMSSALIYFAFCSWRNDVSPLISESKGIFLSTVTIIIGGIVYISTNSTNALPQDQELLLVSIVWFAVFLVSLYTIVFSKYTMLGASKSEIRALFFLATKSTGIRKKTTGSSQSRKTFRWRETSERPETSSEERQGTSSGPEGDSETSESGSDSSSVGPVQVRVV